MSDQCDVYNSHKERMSKHKQCIHENIAVSVIINQIRKKTMHNVSIYEYRLNELYGPDEQDIKYRPDERDDYDYPTTATEIDKYESQISEDDMNTVTTLDCGWAES